MSLQIVQARNDLLSKLGIEDPTQASQLALQDVVVAINGAMQMLQTAGQDYFTRQQMSLTLSAGTAAYNLSSAIQAVIGPVKWNGQKQLRALTSQGELDQFARIFLGESTWGSGTNGEPIGYWIRYDRTGTTGDVCAVTITVAPAPVAPAGYLSLDVVNDAPTYVVADLTSTNILPVAQNYTESIFLPIARMLVTRSSQFSRPDILRQLTDDFGMAMQRLGFSGGFPNARQPGPERTVEA